MLKHTVESGLIILIVAISFLAGHFFTIAMLDEPIEIESAE